MPVEESVVLGKKCIPRSRWDTVVRRKRGACLGGQCSSLVVGHLITAYASVVRGPQQQHGLGGGFFHKVDVWQPAFTAGRSTGSTHTFLSIFVDVKKEKKLRFLGKRSAE